MLDFEFLCDREDAVPTIARWYFDEWGGLRGNDSVERSAEKLQDYMNRDEIPFILLASEGGEAVGAVQLKFREPADPGTGWWHVRAPRLEADRTGNERTT